MKKSIVRKLAFTLVLVLMVRSFLSDFNSIGVRAESEGEFAENVNGDVRLDAELYETIDEDSSVDSITGEELPEDIQNSQEQGMEEVGVEGVQKSGDEEANQENLESDAASGSAEDGTATDDVEGVAGGEGQSNENEPSVEQQPTENVDDSNDQPKEDIANSEPVKEEENVNVNPVATESTQGNDPVADNTDQQAAPVDGASNASTYASSDGEELAPEASSVDPETTEGTDNSEGEVPEESDEIATRRSGEANNQAAVSDGNSGSETDSNAGSETDGNAGSETDGNAGNESEVTGGDASYTIEIYIRKTGGKYPEKPTYIINKDHEMNPNRNKEAKIGQEFEFEPINVVTYKGEAFSFDEKYPQNAKEYLTKVLSKDASENVFKLYYYPDVTWDRVAFYILLPEYKVPTDSVDQPDEQYFPEKGMDYDYEKWLGKAYVDLYKLENRDKNGNYWSTSGESINSMIARGAIVISDETKKMISDDLASDIALKDVEGRSIKKLNDIQVYAGTKHKCASYENIVWYVFKNTAGNDPDNRALHIDGYIRNVNVAVSYFTNYDAKDNKFRTSEEFTGKYKLEDYGFDGVVNKDGKLIRDGKYEFIGWNTERDGSGTSYAPGDEIDLKTSAMFYAQWKPIQPDKLKIKVSLSTDSDGAGRDTYIKYNGAPHRGNLNVNVTIEHEISTAPLATDGRELAVVNKGASEKDKVFAVEEKTAEIALPSGAVVSATVSGLTVTGGYGEHVLPNGAGYPITLETKDAKIMIDGADDYTGKVEFEFDTDGIAPADGVNSEVETSAVIGNLYILPRDVELTSASAEKDYDGNPLWATDITVGGDGFATGDSAEYTNFASQTEVGSTTNTFTYKLVNVVEPLDYNIKVTNGTLTVKDAPKSEDPNKDPDQPKNDTPKNDNPKVDQPKKDTPKKHNTPKKDNPSYNNHDSVDDNTNDEPTVLGEIRPLNGDDNKGAVLGLRRAATEDTTNTARLFVLIGAAAAVAILLFVGKKRKREENSIKY